MDRCHDNRLAVRAFYVGALLCIRQILRRALVELDRLVEEFFDLGELIVFAFLLLGRDGGYAHTLLLMFLLSLPVKLFDHPSRPSRPSVGSGCRWTGGCSVMRGRWL